MTSELERVSFAKPRPVEPRQGRSGDPNHRSDHYWSEDELDVVRQHYPTDGPAACKARLPNRPLSSIYQKAKTLGLAAPKQVGPRQQRAEFPDDLDDQIIAKWPELTARGAVKRFADSLGVKRHTISDRATKLGLTVAHQKEPPWSAMEVDLMSRVPLHNPDFCSRIFRENGFSRTATAIMIKAKRLDMSRAYRETLSGHQAAKILGIDEHSITTRCIDGRIEATKRETGRLSQQGGDPWSITPTALRRYCIDYIAEIDIRKVDRAAFVDLLVLGGSGTASCEYRIEADDDGRSFGLWDRNGDIVFTVPLDRLIGILGPDDADTLTALAETQPR